MLQPTSSDLQPPAPLEYARALLNHQRVAVRVLLSNLPFALALACGGRVPELWKPLLVGACIFLAPGLAWADHRGGDPVLVAFRAFTGAIVAGLSALIVAWLLPGPTPRAGFLLLSAAITNLGLTLGFRRGWYDARPFSSPLARALLGASALFFVQSYVGAAFFIPPLEDQDMEPQGTAYGLVHALKPTMGGMDGSHYYFAHPLLLHFMIGQSALIAGDLDALRYYHEGAHALGERPPGISDEAWETRLYERWERDFEHFMREPHLVATRTPNLWLSALSLLPLGFLAYRLSGRGAAALVACAVYVTLPEVYVRSAYGGYMAIANLLTLFGCYFYLSGAGLLPERELALPSAAGARRHALLAAFLGGWADQKNVILLMATGCHVAVRRLYEGRVFSGLRALAQRPDVLAASAVAMGLLSGWATYVVYGLCLAPGEFIEHHLQGHVLDRLAMTDVNWSGLAHGEWTYLSIVGLWRQFAEHSGWIVTLAAVLALGYGVRRLRAAEGALTLWVALAAIGFSLVDWRQTKHLAQFLPALAVLIGVGWAAQTGRIKALMSAGLGLAVSWNVWRIGQLMHDFEYIKPLPIW